MGDIRWRGTKRLGRVLVHASLVPESILRMQARARQRFRPPMTFPVPKHATALAAFVAARSRVAFGFAILLALVAFVTARSCFAVTLLHASFAAL